MGIRIPLTPLYTKLRKFQEGSEKIEKRCSPLTTPPYVVMYVVVNVNEKGEGQNLGLTR
jgi:hypothetical protein